MIPTHPAGAPGLDRAALRRMKSLDPNLVVTWSPWSIDPITGVPIESPVSEREDHLIEDPAYYLWRKSDTCSHHFFVAVFPVFDHRVVSALEMDAARFYDAKDLWRLYEERDKATREHLQEQYRDKHRDMVGANKTRIDDLLLEGKSGRRKPRAYSGAGGSRTSSAEQDDILMDPREDGWELPERDQ